MFNSGPSDISLLLNAWKTGDQSALDRLTPVIYDEFRRMARRHMQKERPGQTLQTTPHVPIGYRVVRDRYSAARIMNMGSGRRPQSDGPLFFADHSSSGTKRARRRRADSQNSVVVMQCNRITRRKRHMRVNRTNWPTWTACGDTKRRECVEQTFGRVFAR
jgi:hypothetical protein